MAKRFNTKASCRKIRQIATILTLPCGAASNLTALKGDDMKTIMIKYSAGESIAIKPGSGCHRNINAEQIAHAETTEADCLAFYAATVTDCDMRKIDEICKKYTDTKDIRKLLSFEKGVYDQHREQVFNGDYWSE